MAHDIRVLTDDAELAAAAGVFYTALVGFPPPSPSEVVGLLEPGRTLGVFDAGEVVGTATSVAGWIVVPGGRRVTHCAVTDVGILPTHTRRGIAGALIRRQFQDAARRGEIIATLRASEAVIYERFGYGVATIMASAEVTLAKAALRPSVPQTGPVRLVPTDSWELFSRIYAPAAWTGAISRPEYWWNGARMMAGRHTGVSYAAVHGEPGAEDGYVRYQPIDPDSWFGSGPRTIAVEDLIAHTMPAFIGLLRFLLTIDLVEVAQLRTLPFDHPTAELLLDRRAVHTTGLLDETWLRLIDVPKALAARSYRDAGSVVIGVQDTEIPSNAGNYVIGGIDGARRTDADPQLTLNVAALASLYLGGTRWWRLAQAGRVVEHTAGALAIADDLFAADRAPFAGTWF